LVSNPEAKNLRSVSLTGAAISCSATEVLKGTAAESANIFFNQSRLFCMVYEVLFCEFETKKRSLNPEPDQNNLSYKVRNFSLFSNFAPDFLDSVLKEPSHMGFSRK
jgi:hypothetical protein